MYIYIQIDILILVFQFFRQALKTMRQSILFMLNIYPELIYCKGKFKTLYWLEK